MFYCRRPVELTSFKQSSDAYFMSIYRFKKTHKTIPKANSAPVFYNEMHKFHRPAFAQLFGCSLYKTQKKNPRKNRDVLFG